MDMYSIENVIQESLEGIKGRSRPSKIPLNTEEHYENKLTKNIEPTNIWQIYTKFEQIY